MKKSLLIILSLLSLTVGAETRWVTPRGNDNNSGADSSSTGAWLTWRKAFQTAQAGDTVYFRGGIYPVPVTNGAGIGLDPRYPALGGGYNGTRENPIVYINYPGETPILDCQAAVGGSYNRGIRILFANHIKFIGLTVKNVLQTSSSYIPTGILLEWSNNITFENCAVHHIGGVGWGIADNDTIYMTNCDVYNCCDSLSGDAGGNGDGFQTTNLNSKSQTAVVYYYGCRAFNVSDDGYGNYFEGYIEWNNCWAFNNGYNNGEMGDGNSFKHSRATLASISLARKLVNCISANNHGVWGGFVDNSNGFRSLNTQVYNCVEYGSNYGFTLLGFGMGSWSGGNIYRNNIAYANKVANIYDAYGAYQWVHDHNTWESGTGLNVTGDDFVSVDWTELQRSRKSDGSLPDVDFMKLAQGSDLIDAGTDVGLSYAGDAPDLGWHEYGSDVIDSTATNILTFTLTDQISSATINTSGHTVTIQVANGTNLSSLSPAITLSYGATISPASGTAVNFSGGTVSYTVTALDGETTQEWTVTVTINEAPPAAKKFNKVGNKPVFVNGYWVRI